MIVVHNELSINPIQTGLFLACGTGKADSTPKNVFFSGPQNDLVTSSDARITSSLSGSSIMDFLIFPEPLKIGKIDQKVIKIK